MDYRYSLEKLIKHMPHGNYTLSIERRHFYKSNLIKTNKSIIKLYENKWLNEAVATYKCNSIFKSKKEWKESYDLEYIETHVEIIKGGGFKNILSYTPGTYAIFSGKNKKTFFSDNQYKFGETRTISQISQFGRWLEGYPDCFFSIKKNIDESIILINPYPAKASIKVHFLDNIKSIKINSHSAIRIPLSSLLSSKISEYSGQIFVSGRNRQILFFLKHSLDDSSNITTLEHSENFRGEYTYYSMSNAIIKIKQKINKYISQY
jgi:hypothetical protein